MKTHFKNPFLVPGVIAVLGSLAAGRVTAQTFTTLHSFTWSDGVNPVTVALSGNTLYGTAYQGGGSGVGSVFAVNTDGTGFTTLHSFTPIPAYPEPYTNSDGAYIGRVISSGDTLFGVALYGGSGGAGTVFALNTNGTGFTTLYSFTALSEVFSGTNSDGALPDTGLLLAPTGHRSFRDERRFVVAGHQCRVQLHRVRVAGNPGLGGNEWLDDRAGYESAGNNQWAVQYHQADAGPAMVLPPEAPVTRGGGPG